MPDEPQAIEAKSSDAASVYPKSMHAVGTDSVLVNSAVEEAKLRAHGFIPHPEFFAPQIQAERDEIAKAEAARIAVQKAQEETQRQATIKAKADAEARKAQDAKEAAANAKRLEHERRVALEQDILRAKISPLEQKLVRLGELRRALIDDICLAGRSWGDVTEAHEARLVESSAEIRQVKAEIERLSK